jgi:hypothetical protein
MEGQISPHFTALEVVRSSTATRLGIDNTPTKEAWELARDAALNMMEPVRAVFWGPVTVDSWFRCPLLNRAVGGDPSSDHQKGGAIDFTVPGMTVPEAASAILRACWRPPLVGVPPYPQEAWAAHLGALPWSWGNDPGLVISFDQLIMEFHDPSKPDSGWIHMGWRGRDRNRMQVLTIGPKGAGKGLVLE